jgi:nucleoid DNA-binding protein
MKTFTDHITGKRKDKSSEQKREVMERIKKNHPNEYAILQSINTPEMANTFILLHEKSHLDHDDFSKITKDTPYMSEDFLEIETRATLDALRAMDIYFLRSSTSTVKTSGGHTSSIISEETGNGVDFAMRERSDAFITESGSIENPKLDKLKTTFGDKVFTGDGSYFGFKNMAKAPERVMVTRYFGPDQAMSRQFKNFIDEAHSYNPEFLVKDHPNNIPLVKYLVQIGANFTILHTGKSPKSIKLKVVKETQGGYVFNSAGMNEKNASLVTNTMDVYSDYVFLYEDAILDEGNPRGSSIMKVSGTNGVGIKTLQRFAPTKGAMSQIIRDVNGTMSKESQAAIDESIDKIKERIENGEKVVFDMLGYGNSMLEKDKSGNAYAPQTFVYLSRRMFEEFGYQNPKFFGEEMAEFDFETIKREIYKAKETDKELLHHTTDMDIEQTPTRQIQSQQEIDDIDIYNARKQDVTDLINKCKQLGI